MEPANLKSLFDYLREGYTAAHLATAIETHGVCGWDPYNRFGCFKPSSAGAQRALEALAEFVDFEGRYYDERDHRQQHDPDDLDATPAIDELDGFSTPLEAFGWPLEALPSIDKSATNPPNPARRRPAKEPSDALIALGGLLGCLAELRAAGRPLVIPSESVLINKMLEKYPGVKYVKKGSLGDIFTDAKRLIDQESEQNNQHK